MVSGTRAVLAALSLVLLPVAASAATCTWTGGDGDWQDPVHWTGCTGGNGDPANTPGLADTAIVNAAGATITLQQLVFVGQLDFSAGLITGSAPFDVATLNWSGGSFASTPGFATPLYVQNGTFTGNLASTDRFLRLVGTGTVTLSEGADLSVVNNIGVAEPCAEQPFADICINPGSTLDVVSTGDFSQLDATLQNAGRVQIGAVPSSLRIASGQQYIQLEGAELNLQGGELRKLGTSDSLNFGGGTVTGSGRLQAPGNIVFQAARLDVGGPAVGSIVLNAGVALFLEGSRVIFDVLSQGSYDTITGSASVLMQGVAQVRSPLSTSTDSYNLIVTSAVSFSPVAQDIALFTHVLAAASTTLALLPAGGQQCVWSGSADTNFANPANWTGCGSGSPGSGDSALIDTNGPVNINSTTAIARLKLNLGGGGIVVAADQELNISQRLDWVAGDITTSGTSGQVHLNFGGFGSVGDPAGLNDRNLNGKIANGFKLAFVENFGFSMGAGSVFDNSAPVTIINSNTGPAFNIDGGSVINRSTVAVLEGAKYAGSAQFQQIDINSLFVVRSGLAWLNLRGTAFGELRTEGPSALLVHTGAASTDSTSQINGFDGKLVINGTLAVAGQLNAVRVEVDGAGASLTLLGSSTLNIFAMLVRGGAIVDGAASIALAFLELDGGTVAGTGADTLSVANALYVEGSNATSTISNRVVDIGVSAFLIFYNDNTLNITGSSNLLMQGELHVSTQTAGEVATLTGTGIDITGLVRVEPGRVLEFGGSFTPDLSSASDQFIVDGTLQRIGQPLLLDGTTLRGNGTLIGTVSLDNGIVNPGLLDIPPGILTFDGDLTLGSGQTVEMEVGGIAPGAQYDQIVVTGQLDLDNPALDVVPNGPFDPLPGDVFDLLDFASLGASVFGANVAAAFVDTHVVDFDVPPPSATVLQLRPNGGGSAATCIWDGSSASWDDPAHWTGCTGASGNVADTPGAADTAIISAGLAVLAQNTTVGGLQLSGGGINGDFNLTVMTSLDWTGGTVSSSVVREFRINPAASVTLAGGQKNLSGREMEIGGSGSWTTGLINLISGAVVLIEPTSVLTATPGGAPEAIQGNGSLVLEGQLVKTGAGTLKIETGVTSSGTGSLQVTGGQFALLGSGIGIDWDIDVSSGAILEASTFNKSFGTQSSFNGAGTLRFGGVVSQNTVTINGSFTPTGVVEVRWGKLDLTTAAGSVALDTLRLSNPAALVDGADGITISTLLDWQGGTIDATGASTPLTILAGASADLSVSATRIVSSRQFHNQGSMTLNGVFTVDSSEFVNSGTLTINNAGAAQILGSGSPRLFINGGNMDKQGAGILEIGSAIASSQVSFGNDLPMSITLGEVQLYSGGTDTGAYNIGLTGQLHLRGSELFDLEGGVTGQGRLFARDSVTASIRGVVSIERLQVDDSAIVEVDSNLSSTTFSLLRMYGGELRGADDLSAGTLDWQDGVISGTTAQSFTVGTVPSSTLSSGTGVAVDGRILAIGGTLSWTNGSLDLRGGARLLVVPGGQFQMNAPSTAQRSITCSVGCSGVEIENQGTIRAGGVSGAQYSAAGAISWTNAGLLEVANSTLTVNGELITDPGSVIDINSGGTLGGLLGGDSNLDVIEGTLRGNGTVSVGVGLAAGTSLEPNLGGAASSIAVFNIGGNLAHDGGGVLKIDVAGSNAGQFDRIQVAGTVTPGPVEPFDLGIAPGGSVPFLQHGTRLSNYDTLTGTDAADFSFDNSFGSVTSLVRVAGANAAIVVDRSDDPASPGPGDACTAALNDCSLRGAITFANSQPGADAIEFAIPGAPSTVHVIALPSGALPTVTDALSIDGFTQGDATPNTIALNGLDTQLRVAIDGAQSGGGPGLNVQTALFALQGLAIYNVAAAVQVSYTAGGSDVRITGSYLGMRADGVTPGACFAGVGLATGAGVGHIGGATPSERNLIGPCSVAGVDVQGSDTGVEILGNVIGVDRTLAMPAIPGGNGINIEAFSSGAVIHRITIGEPGAGNIIGAMANGIFPTDYFGSSGGGPSGQQAELRIQSNYIGRGPAGQDIGNRVGINFFDRNIPGDVNALLKVGDGTDASLGNVLGFNLWSDVLLDFNFSTVQVGRNQFEGGSAALSIPVNLGINYADSRDGFPQRNPNDDDDPDTGANLLMNHPDISSHTTGASISVSYSVDTLPANANYGPSGLAVDFYEAADGKPARWLARDFYSSADHGGGSTPGTKVFNFTESLASTAKMVAIATDAIGSTSEASYSATQLILDPVSDTPTGTPRTITGTVTVQGISAYTLPAAGGMVMVSDGVDGPVSGSIDGAGNFSIALPTSGAVGSRTLTARFLPVDGIFGVSQGTTPSIVAAGPIATQTAISTVVPTPAAIGQAYTITTTVTALAGSSAPDGTVQIVAGAPFDTDLCVATLAPVSATAASGSCQITSTTPGVRQFSASYAGGSGFNASATAAPTAQVIRTTSSFPAGAIVQTPAQTRVGEPFTINILIRGVGAIPSGTVTVTPQPFGSAQACTLAAVPLSSTDASCALIQVAPAAIGKALQVRYSGSADTVFPAIGTVVFHDTLRALTTAAISAHTPEPSKIDQPVLVQFQVSAAAGAVSSAAPLNGTVRVSDGLDSCTGTLTAITSGTTASGSCSLPLRVAGTRSLVAAYQTNENFEASISTAVSHVVSGAAGGTDLAVSVHNSQRVVNSGTELTYTIEVMNLGTQGAGSSRVENLAPAQLSGVSWTCVPLLPSQCPQSGTGSIDRLVDLVGGGRVTFRMTGLVGAVEGEMVSTATVTAAQGVTDTNPANNSATDRDLIGVFGDGLENPDSE